MYKLPEEQIERITSLLREGKPLPEDYKASLFETKKEYELVYADKAREEDILADTMAVPLQVVKTFQSSNTDVDWANMLIFGDNLQVLKSLLQMKQNGKLKNSDGTSGVRLIYIDPPFATKQDFRGSQDQKAYQDKIVGAEFLEFLRKRLVFIRELLADDGTVYVHLDWKKGHYAKAIMDEVFGEHRFRNEIVWCYSGPTRKMDDFPSKHDVILRYCPKGTCVFNGNDVTVPYSENFMARRKYSEGEGGIYAGRENQVAKEEYVQGKVPEDWWTDIPSGGQISRNELTGYPTQKPERLLNRIVRASSRPGDIVLDCFAGSGTAAAVAEKLGRRWIGVDCGKLAIYTMQKRLLRIAESKSLDDPKKKYGKDCAPFALYNAGLYDYKALKELPWEQYRQFALALFQCRDEPHAIGGLALDGHLGDASVMVFDYQKHESAMVDRTFVEQLHAALGKKIRSRFFLIAPAGSVAFLEDYIELDGVKYYILRIPYSIIEEIHNRGFSKLKQPVSELDVNDTVDAVGFDFVQTPTVDCTYSLEKVKDPDLLNQESKECVIGIKQFESRVISKKPVNLANLESLSMVMLDYDYDGKVFDLDDIFYAEDLKKNGYEVRFASEKIDGQCMIIYLDIFGNEKREIKKLSDFTKRKGR
ncbi:DNA methyltransferase [Candidatus Cryosericum odellii]|jgi:site-specific DNA-methyltransferase (adenine-specific)/adenine-specific DNA-methyltransferase|uniref:site-specific DNA-methyltransferase (adenine-specific) n=1 Tax=Candidatus Cryosericum odellii TaxID=2290917 RepID=A0A398DCX9_9BACT|nr:site-specific DNA-methyltransferase [Candidatus Cryosericum odellii]RIE07641.1 site-specific DNA-methyltransferase [Candidatus Cryosericum odellii]RIE10117.1 site-specific DNA-methyltransferase [Candidatus Cryosericum odellii]